MSDDQLYKVSIILMGGSRVGTISITMHELDGLIDGCSEARRVGGWLRLKIDTQGKELILDPAQIAGFERVPV